MPWLRRAPGLSRLVSHNVSCETGGDDEDDYRGLSQSFSASEVFTALFQSPMM